MESMVDPKSVRQEGSAEGPVLDSMQWVWLKRDLRLSDHEPMRKALEHAAKLGPVALLYIHEPELIARPDFAAQHGAYVAETLLELGRSAQAIGACLVQRLGPPADVLAVLHAERPISAMWSHQETGHAQSYERDKLVARWCRANGVPWRELPQNGVLRGSRYAQGFDFDERLNEASGAELWSARPHPGWARHLMESVDVALVPKGRGADKARRLRGGRAWAWRLLERFCQPERLAGYPGAMSSPLKAVGGCSLLSAALAHGVLSDREVIQSLNNAVIMLQGRAPMWQRAGIRKGAIFFSDRLRWRAGYLQCFERRGSSEHAPDVDAASLASEGLAALDLGPPAGDELFDAWCEGRTGVPMVDASMRMLAAHGWINMRMRGMLASFAVGHLGISWRDAGLHLAREFLDYEPGIHWNQMQIHSGVSRLSSPMSYNPVKQSRDQDPKGVFVRRWVPELAALPDEWIAEPWLMPADLSSSIGFELGKTYPAPVVDMSKAGALARRRLHEPRRLLTAKSKAESVIGGGASGEGADGQAPSMDA